MLNDVERGEILSVLEADFPFAAALEHTDSVHAHIKVEDVDLLPHDGGVQAGER